MTEESTETNKALSRGLLVIEAFGKERPQLTLAQVAEATGLSRAAARRVLLTLKSGGCIDQSDSYFYLTPRILRLGFSFLAAQKIEERIQPILRDIVAATDEPCGFAVLDGLDAVYVAQSHPSNRLLTLNRPIGTRVPVEDTSVGIVLLSTLDKEARLEAIEALTEAKRLPILAQNIAGQAAIFDAG